MFEFSKFSLHYQYFVKLNSAFYSQENNFFNFFCVPHQFMATFILKEMTRQLQEIKREFSFHFNLIFLLKVQIKSNKF